jgi:hypothetical protein
MVKRFVDEFESRFHDEIESISFIYIESSKMGFYDKPKLFGQQVFDRFPSAEYDIVQAGNCFAFDCYTATVMHSMRVLGSWIEFIGPRTESEAFQ